MVTMTMAAMGTKEAAVPAPTPSPVITLSFREYLRSGRTR
jgi:hypothetical protein